MDLYVWVIKKNKPFCDGSHQKTMDEKDGKVYVYDPATGTRTEMNDERKMVVVEARLLSRKVSPNVQLL